jgi:molecular chaperone Hsp33
MTQMLDDGKTCEDILADILGDWELQILDTIPAAFVCNCDRERVEKVVISLGREELGKMIDEGEPVELKCHFCNKAYEFSHDELKKLYNSL